MPMSIPWQYLLPYDHSDDEQDPSAEVAPPATGDNSAIMRIKDQKERAQAIARALSAGVKGADPKKLALLVLDGLLGEDI